uniref:DUF1725 domain-containing protein n=1 Tax=Felis catus TaxID=9685 RepID=A0ABI8AEJ3_FELCA
MQMKTTMRYQTPMFIAALLTIVNIRKQRKYPLIDRWMNKEVGCVCVCVCVCVYYIYHIYIMECYSAIKNSEILPLATTWMNLECVMLSEVSQRKKDKYHMISLICGI